MMNSAAKMRLNAQDIPDIIEFLKLNDFQFESKALELLYLPLKPENGLQRINYKNVL